MFRLRAHRDYSAGRMASFCPTLSVGTEYFQPQHFLNYLNRTTGVAGRNLGARRRLQSKKSVSVSELDRASNIYGVFLAFEAS